MSVKIPDELKSTVPQTTWGKVLASTPVVTAVLATLLAGLASSEMTKAQYDRSLAAQQQSKAGDQWNFFQAKRLRASMQRSTLDLLTANGNVGPLDLAALTSSAGQLPAQLDLVARQAAEAGAGSGPPVSPAPASAPAVAEPLKLYIQSLPRRITEATQVQADILSALEAPGAAAMFADFQQARLPDVGPEPAPDPALQAAMDVVESSVSDREAAAAVRKVKDDVLAQAIRAAKARAAKFDSATAPVNQATGRLETLLGRQQSLLEEARAALLSAGVTARLTATPNREFLAARLRYAAARYDTEARLNQAIGRLYEVQVRRSNLSAERHHARSQRFFFGMLAAQMAVIVSTLAIAARSRNLLWSLAAAAGLLAVAFGAYVYLYV